MYITITLSILLAFSIYLLVKVRSSLKSSEDTNNEIEKTYKPATEQERLLLNVGGDYANLQSSYKDELSELKVSEKRLSQYYLGVGTSDTNSYVSMSNSRDLEVLENQMAETKQSIKNLVSSKKACICQMGKDVTVNGKKSEAKKLFNREVKLRLRCLDNEFKAAAALVDWNNINRLIERSEKAFAEINESGSIVKTYLKKQYLQLKIKELRLNYEINQLKVELKEEEREELRTQREADREEKRIKAAAEKAEKDRELMERLVAEELSKLESSSDEQRALYELHRKELEILKEKEKRAVSLAQLTRAGYVYVISNQLSFGDGIVKIGMTRRADPNDRVKELGDASVPELFDVHAFAFTDDAPSLEKYLHSKFANKRVNLVNGRKEFFYVTPEEVLAEMPNYDGQFEFSEVAA